MFIIQKIVKELNLENKIDCDMCCYSLAPKKYIIFEESDINKANIEYVLKKVSDNCNNGNFSTWKSIIIFGNTTDSFKKKDLLYFDGINTIVVFYLINSLENMIYMNDSWIFPLGMNFRTYVRKINKVMTGMEKCQWV